MGKIKLVALFGPAGSGKDYLLKKVANAGELNKIVLSTTRPPRFGEIYGVDYWFMTNEQFLQEEKQGLIPDKVVFNNWYYGTSIHTLSDEKVNIGAFSIAAIKKLIDIESISVFPVFVYASDKKRLIRQLEREESPDIDEIIRRFYADAKDFEKIPFDYSHISNEGDSSHLPLSDFIKSI